MSGIIAQNTLDNTGLIKSPAGGGTSAYVHIKTLTSDGSDATMSFVDGSDDVVLDTTYKEYIFYFVNLHPETHDDQLHFNGSDDTGSSYAVSGANSIFRATHSEAGTAAFAQDTGNDSAMTTANKHLIVSISADADACVSGWLHLFDPGGTSYIKPYQSKIQQLEAGNFAHVANAAGYFDTTSAVDAIQFLFNVGEIQGGKIILYGLSTS